MSISSDVIRGYNDTMILHILTQGDSYGYDISKRIRQISREKYMIKETTLYSAFTRLEKNGHIQSYPGTETRGKQRTYYRITSDGMAHYRDKCQEWGLAKEIIDQFIAEEGDAHGDH